MMSVLSTMARRAWRRTKKLFDFNEKHIRRLAPRVAEVNAWEPRVRALSDAQLRAKTDEFRERLAQGETLDDLLPEAFAVVREASWRTLGQRPFDVQLMGGIALHEGKIAEMKTGEGKTLVATLPLYLNALEGQGAHLVTVNDYLAKRDACWMGAIYHFLGLTVGIIQSAGGRSVDEASFQYDPDFEPDDPRQRFLRPITRRETYRCDITYGTNHEFGFDYLRDNYATMRAEDLVQPHLHYGILDEVDSILIDEARVPLIISGPSQRSPELYYKVDRIIATLREELDYTVDEKARTATLTEEGTAKVERALGVDNISDPENIVLNHHVQSGLKAHTVFRRDRDYVVKDGEIIIVDEFTGRLMPGRRWSDGLHQAIEAKERVPIQHESQTLATITYQNFFRMYDKLGGMTGTAKTEESEFVRIYGTEVVVIPTNRPMVRLDNADVVYKSEEAKFRGIVYEILQTYVRQQPMLVGTRSIEVSERLSERLMAEPLQMQVLLGLIQDRLRARGEMSRADLEQARQESYIPLDQLTPQQVSRLAVRVGLNPNLFEGRNLDRVMELLGLPEEHRPLLLEALRAGIPHNVLNAKHHEREAQIIAEAGHKGAVTIATNMAGRGVDIILGGSTGEKAAEEWTEQHEHYARQIVEAKKARFTLMGYSPVPSEEEMYEELQGRTLEALEVQALGGLHVIGTERHESRRIDNQLRGRSGRQGDLGSSRFYVSLQDELMRLFAPEARGKRLLQQWPEDEPVEAGLISKLIENAQKRVELHNFKIREYTLKYDDVMNLQRERIYSERRKVLMGADLQETIGAMFDQVVDDHIKEYANPDLAPEEWQIQELYRSLRRLVPQLPAYVSEQYLEEIESPAEFEQTLKNALAEIYQDKEEELTPTVLRQNEREITLRVIDNGWIEHLETMDYLRDAIGLRAYGQTDPLVAYQKEAYQYFQALTRRIREEIIYYLCRVESIIERQVQHRTFQLGTGRIPSVAQPQADETGDAGHDDGQQVADGKPSQPVRVQKVGRNDPCPCGSGKKYKKCCMLKEQV